MNKRIAMIMLLLSGCGAPKFVDGAAVFSALTTVSANIQSANGIYTNCVSHTDGDMWSVSADGSSPLDYTRANVVLHDVTCSLTLTQLHTDSGIESTNVGILLSNSPSGQVPSAFGMNNDLYANAYYGGNFSGIWDADFTIIILYGDTAQSVVSVNAGYTTIKGSAIAMEVPAPDYSLSFSFMSPDIFFINVDANNVITGFGGYGSLTPGNVLGNLATNGLMVADGAISNDYASVMNIWMSNGGNPIATLPDGEVPGNTMLHGFPGNNWVGQTLPMTKTLIIANTESATGSGVTSFETIEVTFNPPQ